MNATTTNAAYMYGQKVFLPGGHVGRLQSVMLVEGQWCYEAVREFTTRPMTWREVEETQPGLYTAWYWEWELRLV